MGTPAIQQFGGDNALADKIRAKYPGAYDDMSDVQLAAAIVQKHPEYQDLSLPYDAQIQRGGKWTPVRLETLSPEERNQAQGYAPPETGGLKHTYEGAKMGAMMATAPLAAESLAVKGLAAIPSLAGGLAGGVAGGVAAQKGAKALGAGEFGQEVAGDVGGITGGIAGGLGAEAFANTRAGKAATAIIGALVKKLPVSALRRIPYAGDVIADLFMAGAKAHQAATLGLPELDATGENVPYAGAARPKLEVLDATGENKPFAGGMDEWSPKLPKAPAPPTAPQSPPMPGAAGSMAASVAQPKPKVILTNDPILNKLRLIAAKIQMTPTEASPTVSPENLSQPVVPEGIDDLTGLLQESLKRELAKANQ